jgi:phosphoglycerate dehydrogenase-like enzyme
MQCEKKQLLDMPNTIKVAVLDDYQRNAESLGYWSDLAGVTTVFFHDHISDLNQLVARLEPFAVVVVIRERTRFGADLISRLPNLELLVTIGKWNAAIDLEAAKAHNVLVTGTEGVDLDSTPILTWALILGFARNLHVEAASVRAGGWQIGMGMDLPGKTLGLLGLGRIGQVLARYGAAFKMRVIAWSQNLTVERAAEHGVEYVEKAELFRQADILSVHLRLSERTRGLVGEHELQLMKSTAYLVNTSRGPIVSEPALIAALQSGAIKGAALDVFDPEPLPASHPFRFLPNVLATPHVGYVTENTYSTAFRQIGEDIRAWLDGKPIRVMN